MPQLNEGTECIRGRLQQHAGKTAFCAMCGQGAAEHHPVPVCGSHFEIDSPGFAAAAARSEAHVILYDEIVRCRMSEDIDPSCAGIGYHPEFDRLEIHHQRVRHDVVGAIRPAVEFSGILGRQGERAIVDDDVAVNRLEPAGAQRLREAPPTLQGHVGVAAAMQVEISVEHAGLDLAANRGLRMPGVRRPQQVQGRKRGDDLDGRGGTARSIRVLTEHQAAGT